MVKIKYLVLLITLVLTVLQGNSQNTLTVKPSRVQIFVDTHGDTMVIMSHEDARILLHDLLDYQYTDSLLTEYEKRDSIQNNKIELNLRLINNLTSEKINLETIVTKLERVNGNNSVIIDDLNREIKKQKRFKFLGITGSIVLPILTYIIIK